MSNILTLFKQLGTIIREILMIDSRPLSMLFMTGEIRNLATLPPRYMKPKRISTSSITSAPNLAS